MHLPKHRATRVPTTRLRITKLSAVAVGAIALGAATLTASPASAATVNTATPAAFAARVAAHPASAVSFGSIRSGVATRTVTVHAASAHTSSVRTSSAVQAAAIRGRAVRAASTRRGTPYRWGAAGPRAFDCSGLTQWSYRQAGIRLPRTVIAQSRATRRVARSAKVPGDLIFYYSHGRPYHMGIYAGRNMVWVARHSGTRITLQKIYTSQYYVGRVV